MSFLTLNKQNEFNHDFINDFFSIPSLVVNNSLRAKEITMDLYEGKESIRAELDLPGFDSESLDIDIKDNIVTFRGSRQASEEKLTGTSFYREIKRGSFERRIRLPYRPKAEEVKAEFKNGVLKVEFPRPEKELNEKVSIKIEDGP